jgi:hypothetical protein
MKNEKMKHADSYRTVSACSEMKRETLYVTRVGHRWNINFGILNALACGRVDYQKLSYYLITKYRQMRKLQEINGKGRFKTSKTEILVVTHSS